MESASKTILIVDDEADILEFISYNLKREGFNVYTAVNGKDALVKTKELHPDLIFLDVMMPGMDGIMVCEQIRKTPEIDQTIIAMLTARAESYSQIAGLEAGADDYIIKPIRPKLLVSRINALIKRSNYSSAAGESNNADQRVFGNISISMEQHKVIINDKDVNLPKKEFQLLSLLTSKPSRVFTREEIYNHVWGEDIYVSDRTIDVYIRKLREKIGQEKIVTIKSVGYKFVL